MQPFPVIFYEREWRAGLTGHGQSSQLANFQKFAKLHFLTHAWDLKKNEPYEFIQSGKEYSLEFSSESAIGSVKVQI